MQKEVLRCQSQRECWCCLFLFQADLQATLHAIIAALHELMCLTALLPVAMPSLTDANRAPPHIRVRVRHRPAMVTQKGWHVQQMDVVSTTYKNLLVFLAGHAGRECAAATAAAAHAQQALRHRKLPCMTCFQMPVTQRRPHCRIQSKRQGLILVL